MIKISDDREYSSDSILNLEELSKVIEDLRKKGKKVGLCHGGFDLMHPGHISHFRLAKDLCDVLVVSITSDKFVKGRKGPGRPIIPDKLRAFSVASIRSVDYVTVVDFKSGVEVIQKLKPNYYIKGPDYINKKTPGILSEKYAIEKMGGELKLIQQYKLATTEIIDYIKDKVGKKSLLLILDRDGTIIEDVGFIGKTDDWKSKIKLNEDVTLKIKELQENYKATTMVVSNQSGVARKMFTTKRVEEINKLVDTMLRKEDIVIDNWQYCPDVDTWFSKESREHFDPNYVKDRSKRKPHPDMVLDGLKVLDKRINDFDKVIVIGDRHEDKGLAENLGAEFIDAN